MTLEKINGWLGLLGQLAVFGGLVALVIEIRGNTLSTRAQELASIVERDGTRQIALFDSDLRRVYTKALFSPNDLTVEEMIGAGLYLNYRVGTVYSAYVGYRNGTLLESDWETFVRNVAFFLGTEFGRKWWELSKSDFELHPDDKPFVEAIDEILKETSRLPDDVYYAKLCEKLEMSNCPSR